MTEIALQIPDIILKSHYNDINQIKKEVHEGFIIWEYLNGHLSFQECGELLKINYREFFELLWNKGIPIDGLNEKDLQRQLENVKRVLNR
ncbi:UPF0175 family protein [candidate division KSB1 bacterium]|nr:UPF0175 family protein [candidate division KSB1 bacterium]